MKHMNDQVVRLPLFSGEAMTQNDYVLAIVEKAKIMRAQVIANAISDFRASIKGYFSAKRNVRTLSQLSDAVLADIGIERAQIPAIAKGLANGTFPAATASTHVLAVLGKSNEKANVSDQGELPLAA